MKKWLAASLAMFCAMAMSQAPVAPAPADQPVRLRGTITSYSGTSLVIRERSGEVVTLAAPEGVRISEVMPIELNSIQAGSYIGTAAMPAADGTLTALEVLVFPEAMRGTGEGFRAWDLQPGSTMTNATVADVVSAPQGRTLKVKYKEGEKTVVVPEGVPVVTFKPGDKALLVTGAKVLVSAQMKGGQPTALSIQVGRNGFAPPM